MLIKIKILLLAFIYIPLYFNQFIKKVFNFVLYQKSERFAKQYDISEIGINDVIPCIDDFIESFSSLADTSLPIDLVFIKAVLKSKTNSDYLEIGSFRGESLLNAISYSKSTTSISLSKEELFQITNNKDLAEVDSCLITKEYPNYTKIAYNSQSFDFNSLNKKFDLIFIDGDHSEDGVMNDTSNAFKLLKDENSLIIWHDFGYSTSDLRYDVIAGAMKGLPKEEWVNMYRVRNTLCGLYSKKKIESSLPKNRYKPNVLFKIHFQQES